MEINYKQKLINIKAFIFDVDGVLTDGSLLISETGELLRTMNVKDGFAMKTSCPNWAVFWTKNTSKDLIIMLETFERLPEPIAGIKFPAK